MSDLVDVARFLGLTRLEEDILRELARRDKRSLRDQVRFLIEIYGKETGVKASLLEPKAIRYPANIAARARQVDETIQGTGRGSGE